MFKITVKDTIIEVSNCLLGFNNLDRVLVSVNSNKRAAYFVFDIRCKYNRNFLNKSDYDLVAKTMTVVVTECYEVFYALTEWLEVPQVQDFKFVTRHDTGWRDFNFINHTYFSMAKEVHPEVAPVCLEWDISCGLRSNPIKLVKVTTVAADSEGYKRKLESVSDA